MGLAGAYLIDMKLGFLVAGLGLLACVGCSAEVDGGSTSPADVRDGSEPGPSLVGPSAGRAAAENRARMGGPVAIGEESAAPDGAFVCRKGAFCDDFEGATIGAAWTDIVEGGGQLGRASTSASVGKGALHVVTRDASESAFLVREKGFVGGSWSGVFGFALRAEAIPSESFAGPELTVKTASDGVVTLAVVMKPEGLFLEQRGTAECGKDRCQDKSTLLAPARAGHWYRVDLGVEAGAAAAAAPYGRVEFRVDGGALGATDLVVPLGEGTALLRAGVTRGDVRPAHVAIDDVVLLTR